MPNTTEESNAITVSLDMAKRLKDAGWIKQTYFSHSDTDVDLGKSYDELQITRFSECFWSAGQDVERYYAPTSQELLDTLPSGTRVISSHHLEYIANNIEDKRLTVNGSGPNSQEALADFWIYCKENNYID